MKQFLFVVTVILFISCNSAENKTIDLKRETVNKNPVADYSEKVPDVLNKDWVFKVQLFETDSTFVYTLRTNYKAIDYDQKIRYPNLGYLPRPALKKGFYDKTVMVGFLDEKGKFMDYKMVYVLDEEVGIRGVKKYTVKEGE
ncbi:MAG: hypothetical protein HYX40_00735 [Sphingobacteriales bacterium]|nr:hypothetical protein [Sphingobacteriales bacterium]